MKTILGFGEIMLRLSTINYDLISEARSFDVYYGGSEANVLIGLSHLGNSTRYLTQLPDNKVGKSVVQYLKNNDVDTSNIILNGDNVGIYFVESGFGHRPSDVIYNRKNAAITQINENAINYDELFRDCSWLHICGISLALSECVNNVCFRLASEAKKRNVKVSFDFNYRSKLWTIEEAKKSYKRFLPYVDVCFGNLFDLKNLLDVPYDGDEAIKYFLKKYDVSYLIGTKRICTSATNNTLSAYSYKIVNDNLQCYNSRKREFEILDRIGAGDAFSSGIINVLNKDYNNIEYAVEFGLVCDILKQTIKGDAFTLALTDVERCLQNDSKDVKR